MEKASKVMSNNYAEFVEKQLILLHNNFPKKKVSEIIGIQVRLEIKSCLDTYLESIDNKKFSFDMKDISNTVLEVGKAFTNFLNEFEKHAKKTNSQ